MMQKFESIKKQTLFSKLNDKSQIALTEIATTHRFSLQELKIFCEFEIDLVMWGELTAIEFWNSQSFQNLDPMARKNKIWPLLLRHHQSAQKKPRFYSPSFAPNYQRKKQNIITTESPKSKIFGPCPVASEKTVCCNLYTIDAVKNCGYSCSYCSIQTMFKEPEIIFDQEFSQKISSLTFDPNKTYHIGTGQSSDALLWGNRNGQLEILCDLASKNSNVILEFKTKSANIDWLISNKPPKNVICSWSLNAQEVIKNEEHLTASLEMRIEAARKIADARNLVAFHFHPIFEIENWQQEYGKLFELVQKSFSPEEVAFISFGTLTFPKPVLNKIRQYPYMTKILQMPFEPNPEGKLTYPKAIKQSLFSFAYQSFSNWHNLVFFYLCMEPAEIWHSVFGRCYSNNSEFEQDLSLGVFKKIGNI